LGLIAALALVSGCATMPRGYTALREGRNLELQELLQEVQQARVVFVGEAHTSRQDHLVQLRVLRHLRQQGRAVALAVEMFPPEAQEVLDEWLAGRVSDKAFRKLFRQYWEMPFSYYRGLFRYAKAEGIPVFGINALRQDIQRVARQGLAAVPPELLQLLRFRPCAQEPSYVQALGFNRLRHRGSLGHLCDAQRLRDTIMAYHMARILESTPYTLVAIMGAGHASRPAVPRLLLERMPGLQIKVLLPRNMQHMVGRDLDVSMGDYIWF